MDALPPDGSGSIYVGFDTEWNVNVSDHGFITSRGQTAIIQIAHQDVIYWPALSGPLFHLADK
jgi:hypothetical protein